MPTNKVRIQLEYQLRDYIVEAMEWLISDEALSSLGKARINKDGCISCNIDKFDLEQLVGELSHKSLHDSDPSTRELAEVAAEILSIYL